MANARRIVLLDDVVAPEARRQAEELGLQCSVCHGLLQSPLETTCGHLFCSDCLTVASCPVCRTPLQEGSKRLVAPASQAFQRLLAGVRCRCPHAPAPPPKKRKAAAAVVEACDWTGSYGDLLAKHLGQCDFEAAPCARGCGADVRRKDVARHLAAECSVGARCEICQKHVPTSGKAAHDRSAAGLHVELLRRRVEDLQRAAARPSCAAVWDLRRGAADVPVGTRLVSSTAGFDLPCWSRPVSGKLRFWPRGTETSDGYAVLEAELVAADCVVEIAVRVAAASGTTSCEARLDLSRAKAKHSWTKTFKLGDADLHDDVRVEWSVRGLKLLLKTLDGDK